MSNEDGQKSTVAYLRSLADRIEKGEWAISFVDVDITCENDRYHSVGESLNPKKIVTGQVIKIGMVIPDPYKDHPAKKQSSGKYIGRSVPVWLLQSPTDTASVSSLGKVGEDWNTTLESIEPEEGE